MGISTHISRTWKCDFCPKQVERKLRAEDTGSDESEGEYSHHANDEHGFRALPDHTWAVVEVSSPHCVGREVVMCPNCVDRLNEIRGDTFAELIAAYMKLLKGKK